MRQSIRSCYLNSTRHFIWHLNLPPILDIAAAASARDRNDSGQRQTCESAGTLDDGAFGHRVRTKGTEVAVQSRWRTPPRAWRTEGRPCSPSPSLFGLWRQHSSRLGSYRGLEWSRKLHRTTTSSSSHGSVEESGDSRCVQCAD